MCVFLLLFFKPLHRTSYCMSVWLFTFCQHSSNEFAFVVESKNFVEFVCAGWRICAYIHDMCKQAYVSFLHHCIGTPSAMCARLPCIIFTLAHYYKFWYNLPLTYWVSELLFIDDKIDWNVKLLPLFVDDKVLSASKLELGKKSNVSKARCFFIRSSAGGIVSRCLFASNER